VSSPELDRSELADSILGFHAQQAVEKWLKAVLASKSVDFEYTHDLRRLIELIEGAGITLPLNTPEIVMYTEFAVPLRYEDLLDAEPLDRRAAVTLVMKWELGPRECWTQTTGRQCGG
jgi:HEPN domain-containing protein